LRVFIVAAALGFLALPRPGHSEEKNRMNAEASKSEKTSAGVQADQSSAIAKEARNRSEALERTRDRNMRKVSISICVGC
jgi:hypothetical protein